jgi:DNA polymerase I-like protein with 3'-5' exonuclease and polymerase domains
MPTNPPPNPESIRETFLADAGEVFVRADESQVEDRMGKMYCGSERMLRLANLPPWEYDAHTDNASTIFGQDITKLPKAEYKQKRYLGKKVVHASWRQMAGDKMSESVSKDTDGEVFIPAKRCRKLIETYLAKNPEIEGIYFPWVRKQVIQSGILYNSWGRPFDVRDFRIDAELYRKCYSFFMQSECADLTNQYAVIPGNTYMLARYNKPLAAQIHDEVVASVPPKEAYDFALYIKNAIEQTREVPARSGRRVLVPAEITVGISLYGGVEFKRLPSREEFDRKVGEYLEEVGFYDNLEN